MDDARQVFVQVAGLFCALLAAQEDAPQRLKEALAFEGRGDDARALEAVDSLVRARPNWELPRLEAARLRLKTGADLDRAQADLEAARAIAPENGRGQFLWGLLMEERREPAEAVRAYELALLYRPDYDEARLRLGNAAFGMGEFARAEAAFRTLARAHPDDANAGLQLAAALERLNRLEDAELELRKLFDRFPGPGVVYRRLAEFYDRTGRPQLAAKVRKQVEKPKKKMRPLKKSAR